MNKVLMKDYVFKIIDEYVFVKKVYFEYTNEKVYFDVLVYSQKYRSNIECLAENVDAINFNKTVKQTIKSYLKQKGVNYEKY